MPIIFLVILIGLLGYFYVKTDTQLNTSSVLAEKSLTNLVPPITAADHIIGNSNAKITFIEYSDFECLACQLFQPTIKQLLKTYESKIRWITRPYPLPQHLNAEKEAEAAQCVAEVGGNDAYWNFNDKIFSQVKSRDNGTGYPLNGLSRLAGEIGINQALFQKCLDSGKYYTDIQNTITQAESAGIHQLPTTFFSDGNGKFQFITDNQPYKVFQTMIDNALTN